MYKSYHTLWALTLLILVFTQYEIGNRCLSDMKVPDLFMLVIVGMTPFICIAEEMRKKKK